MRNLLVLGMATLLALAAVPCGAADVTLLPTASATVTNPQLSSNGFVLLQFALPGDLAGAKILRAVLHYEVACDGEGSTIWARPAQAAWVPGVVSWSSRVELGAEEISPQIESVEVWDCAHPAVNLDIGAWVRSWAKGASPNRGILLRSPTGQTSGVSPVQGEQYATPVLHIIYRPAAQED